MGLGHKTSSLQTVFFEVEVHVREIYYMKIFESAELPDALLLHQLGRLIEKGIEDPCHSEHASDDGAGRREEVIEGLAHFLDQDLHGGEVEGDLDAWDVV